MARDVVERLGRRYPMVKVLSRAEGDALLAVVRAAKAVSDAENIEAETHKDARTLCALDDALARLYAGSSGETE